MDWSNPDMMPCNCGSRNITEISPAGPHTEWLCSQCGELLGEAFTGIDDRESSGPLEFAMSPWSRRQGLEAVFREKLRTPIHAERWRVRGKTLAAAIRKLAQELGTSQDFVTWLVGNHAISRALETLRREGVRLVFAGTDLDPESVKAWVTTFRRLVNEEATRYLLGDDWRNPLVYNDPRPVDHAERRVALEIELMLRSPRLTRLEQQTIRAYRAADDEREAAHRLGCSVSTLRKRLRRIGHKLSA
jgi:hypothetical protein